jgi:5-methyltetrahydrofolate--homocysteine methyltransferase
MLQAKEFEAAVLQGDRDAVRALVSGALASGAEPVRILNEGLLPAMEVVGQRFGAKTMYIGGVLLSARAMHAGLGLLRPLLVQGRDPAGPRRVVVLGTVKGDLHDIGKNLVAMMLEAGGFDVVDLGTNVGPEKFVQAIRQHRPAVVGLSALLTTTMRQMRQTIQDLRNAGVMDGVKTMVGGAPVTQEFADTIGADAYAPDAAGAVATLKKLLAVA